MTTNTTSTASQAPAVTIDSEEFSSLLAQVAILWMADPLRYAQAREKLITHIDAELAQAREEAIGVLAIAFEKMLCAAVGRDWSPSGISASSLVEELRSLAEKANDRATAAEAKLEAIRQGVDEMHSKYQPTTERDAGWRTCHAQIRSVIAAALLQPQPQSDESGLPG